MLHYLVYLATSGQIHQVKNSLTRLQIPQAASPENEDVMHIVHPFLGDLEIVLTFLSDINQVSTHIKHNPVDALIYDERQGGLDAFIAIQKIEDNIAFLAQQWGPDFRLPKGRIIVLLEDSEEVAEKSFKLGRMNVKDIHVAPPHFAKTLRWIARVLTAAREHTDGKVGMACNGGGMEGYLFQAGCLYALSKVFKKRSIEDFQVYSGVSSGSIHATALAAGIPIDEIVRSIKGKSTRIPHLKSSMIYDFSPSEILKRFAKQMQDWGSLSPSTWMTKAMQFIPTGILKGEGLLKYITNSIKSYGIIDDFSSLNSELYIGTTHQDTFEHVVMGASPFHHVRMSDAIRASCAVPPFFTPHKIENEYYIDGQISSPCDLELLIRRGCSLIFIVDPIIPYSTPETGLTENAGGLYNLIQTIKTLINARFRSELAHTIERYPDVDFLVFQPYGECSSVMRGSPLKYKFNTKITDLAYKGTLQRFRERYEVYSSKLSKYGFELVSPEELLRLEQEGIVV